jgi:hypothetical protein
MGYSNPPFLAQTQSLGYHLTFLMLQFAYKQTDFILTANLMYWNWDPQDYIDRRTYRSLKRARIGFKIAKKDGDQDKMKYYAEGIQKFERQLRLPVSTFSDILKEETENDLDATMQKEEGVAATNELSPS